MGIREKMLRKAVEKKIEKKVQQELGNKSLAYTSRVLIGIARTNIKGKAIVRERIINGISNDMKRAIKKSKYKTVDALMQDKLVQDAFNTPDYMDLLKELEMDESHLRLLAKEALQNAKRI